MRDTGGEVPVRVAALALTLLWAACAGPGGIDAPDAGRTATYEPGVPAFDLEAVAAFRADTAGLDVYTSLVPSSLALVRADTGFAARYELALRIRDARGRETEAFQAFADTLVVPTAEAGRQAERIRRRTWFPLAPGRWTVEATLEDRNTGERTVRRQRLDVPEEAGPWLGRPLVYGPDDALPTSALHLPADGTVRTVRTETRGLPPSAVLDAALYRLAADTSVAHPPFWLGVPRGSLAYRGLDTERPADTLLVTTARPSLDTGTVEVLLPLLDPGVYRFVLALPDTGEAAALRQERALSVQRPDFPNVTTLDALIEALAYIAYPNELEHVRSGATARERRLRFDAFWGALVPDRRVAGNLLRQYAERVEEANVRFTGVKAGWKTDRGMIYILFGAPGYVEPTFEGEVWHYGTTGEQAGTFTFERVGWGEAIAPFEHLLLVRQPIYERAWLRARERWRSGEVR